MVINFSVLFKAPPVLVSHGSYKNFCHWTYKRFDPLSFNGYLKALGIVVCSLLKKEPSVRYG